MTDPETEVLPDSLRQLRVRAVCPARPHRRVREETAQCPWKVGFVAEPLAVVADAERVPTPPRSRRGTAD